MIRALGILLFGTLFFTSLTTPLVYQLLLGFFDPFPWPFSRVYDRVAMLWAAIFLLLYRKEFSLTLLREHFMTIPKKRMALMIAIGISLTVIPSLFLVPYYVDGVVFHWKEDGVMRALWKLPKVIPAALLISLIEESFFRVIFYEKAKQYLTLSMAMVVTSALYAFVHFIAPVKSWEYPGYSLFVGFEYLGAVVERMQAPGVLPAAFGLFLVGIVLCCIIQRSRSLFLCIGMHAGWVIALKMASASTVVAEGYVFSLGAGRRYFLVSEWVSWVLVIGIGVLAYAVARYFARSEDNAA